MLSKVLRSLIALCLFTLLWLAGGALIAGAQDAASTVVQHQIGVVTTQDANSVVTQFMPGQFQPRMVWFNWANQPKPFGRSFLFILLFALITIKLMPDWLRQSHAVVRSKFWSTLVVGILVLIVFLTAIRAVFMTQIGMPLGIGLGAVFELSLLCGLSSMVALIGQTVAYYMRMDSWSVISDRPRLRAFLKLAIGSLVCALILQLPGMGPLPKIGTRVVGLLALLGLGGLYRSRGVNRTE